MTDEEIKEWEEKEWKEAIEHVCSDLIDEKGPFAVCLVDSEGEIAMGYAEEECLSHSFPRKKIARPFRVCAINSERSISGRYHSALN